MIFVDASPFNYAVNLDAPQQSVSTVSHGCGVVA